MISFDLKKTFSIDPQGGSNVIIQTPKGSPNTNTHQER